MCGWVVCEVGCARVGGVWSLAMRWSGFEAWALVECTHPLDVSDDDKVHRALDLRHFVPLDFGLFDTFDDSLDDQEKIRRRFHLG